MINDRIYIIEVLNTKVKKQKEIDHPFFFTRIYSKYDIPVFTMHDLLYYMRFGQGRDNTSKSSALPAFMESIGLSYREKTGK